ncbi:lasso RiPP family leader peptide-containing protein [Streptomyces olivoreticuli]
MTDLMECTEAPTAEVYEPPALVEVGDFGRLTLGSPGGSVLEEGGEGQLWYWR